eukprot:1143382-Rhodomonas_salina.2
MHCLYDVRYQRSLRAPMVLWLGYAVSSTDVGSAYCAWACAMRCPVATYAMRLCPLPCSACTV